ncbi:MAG: amidohydrolase family protein [Candidatus Eisenbacteria bacterium]
MRYVIPHFGAGFFREALMVASQCDNVFGHLQLQRLEESPSENPSLAEVFARALDVVGSERILFGTDAPSTFRGDGDATFTPSRSRRSKRSEPERRRRRRSSTTTWSACWI